MCRSIINLLTKKHNMQEHDDLAECENNEG